ncbi:MAG: TrkH family potassium uptake protein [Acidimicrobiales bacterium]
MARHSVLGIQSTPARLLVAMFLLVLVAGTALLAMPISSVDDGGAPLVQALFTATSALTVTGLVVVDTPTYWSTFGQAVLMVLIQLGGLGIITLGSLAGLIVSRRIGLRGRRVAQVETGGTLDLGDIARVIKGVLVVAFGVEAVLFVVLTATFWLRHGEAWWAAIELGGFHAVSAFNNAGFALFSDSLQGFVTDPFINVIVAVAVVAGAVGFPVLNDLRSSPKRPRRWSMHTKLTLTTTGLILLGGALVLLVFEWTNPATLGGLDTGHKVLASGFNATMRTAGFSTIDYGATNETTQLATIISMFIGGGSVSAAGGIKVTTMALLVLAVWAEYRGDSDVTAFGRRMPSTLVRQAIAVTITVALAQLAGTMLLLATGPWELTEALFEATSAVGIVGLSTGITPDLDPEGKLIVIMLMVLGRLGPLTVGTALVLRERDRLYRYPQERPFIG